MDIKENKEMDLKQIREEIQKMCNDLFEIIDIPFEETSELQRQIVATFAFGMLNAVGLMNKLAPPDVHALAIIMLKESFKYSNNQSVDFTESLIHAASCGDENNTLNAIIHRGIDGHYHYISGEKDKVRENIMNIIQILEEK